MEPDNQVAKCALCGEPMPEGEEMFKYHGFSGPCPKPARLTGTEPSLATEQAKATVATKPAPRVTEESIKAKIASVEYILHDVMTLCVITMRSGFKVVGKSAPASRENFDLEVGKRYAYNDAFRQLWPLEGYLLRDRLASTETDGPT